MSRLLGAGYKYLAEAQAHAALATVGEPGQCSCPYSPRLGCTVPSRLGQPTTPATKLGSTRLMPQIALSSGTPRVPCLNARAWELPNRVCGLASRNPAEPTLFQPRDGGLRTRVAHEHPHSRSQGIICRLARCCRAARKASTASEHHCTCQLDQCSVADNCK
jgi:hypothetical protein